MGREIARVIIIGIAAMAFVLTALAIAILLSHGLMLGR